jgi:hypothetical protein
MSSRIRNSNARPTVSRPSQAYRPATDQLPPYKKPSHPLDAEATNALRSLQNNNIRELEKHNRQALESITGTATSVNDMLRGVHRATPKEVGCRQEPR